MIKKTILIFANLFILAGIIITAIEIASFDQSFYRQQFCKLGVAKEVGVSESDLMQVTTLLFDYTQGKVESLEIYVPIFGRNKLYYNKKEMEHMIDVKNLYFAATGFRNIVMVSGVVALLALLQEHKLRFTALKTALVGCGAVICALGIMVLSDFDAFWVNFHYVVFDNELWLLNPATDNLINMVPLEFFYALVIRIFIYTIAGLMVYTLVNYLVMRYYENKQAEAKE